MTRRTWVYIWSVLLGGVALAGVFAPSFATTTPDWSLFVVLTAFATAAQLFEAVHGRQSFYPHFVFFFAGVLLLHPFLFAPRSVQQAKLHIFWESPSTLTGRIEDQLGSSH